MRCQHKDSVYVWKKTATCSAYVYYQLVGEPLPEVGAYSVILNHLDEPVTMIIKRSGYFVQKINLPKYYSHGSISVPIFFDSKSDKCVD